MKETKTKFKIVFKKFNKTKKVNNDLRMKIKEIINKQTLTEETKNKLSDTINNGILTKLCKMNIESRKCQIDAELKHFCQTMLFYSPKE